MMRDELFSEIERLEREIKTLSENFTTIKTLAVALAEENVSLEIERDNYKKLLKESSSEKDESFKENTLKSLYDEGFHVCSVKFGEHRQGESCLFCLEFLDRKR